MPGLLFKKIRYNKCELMQIVWSQYWLFYLNVCLVNCVYWLICPVIVFLFFSVFVFAYSSLEIRTTDILYF